MSSYIKSAEYCFASSCAVNELCRPLFESTDIDYFCQISINKKTNKRYFLTNKPEWLRHFYEKKYYNNKVVVSAERHEAFLFYIWSDFFDENLFIDGKDFGLNNGISFITTSDEELKVYCFGSSHSKSPDYFLNHSNEFKYFTNYFYNQAISLASDAERNAFILPEDSAVQKLPNKPVNSTLMHAIKFERFYINKNCYLTKSEAICLYVSMQGCSSKTVACILGISNRTVETHIAATKVKLGTKKITAIMNILVQKGRYAEFNQYCEQTLITNFKKG